MALFSYIKGDRIKIHIKSGETLNLGVLSTRHFHSTPFQHPKQSFILRLMPINPNDTFQNIGTFKRASKRSLPFYQLILADPREQHEHARDDIRFGLHVKRCGVFIRSLRDEEQRNVLVLQN